MSISEAEEREEEGPIDITTDFTIHTNSRKNPSNTSENNIHLTHFRTVDSNPKIVSKKNKEKLSYQKNNLMNTNMSHSRKNKKKNNRKHSNLPHSPSNNSPKNHQVNPFGNPSKSFPKRNNPRNKKNPSLAI